MKYYVMLFLLFLGMYIAPLSFRPMITPDEFRYAEIPREMVESGNWVKPRLAGMDYFEKPALGYQMTAVSFKIFGYNNFALRFPPALATGLTALLLVLFLRRYTRNDRIAVMGGVLYLDMGLVFALGNCAVLDAQVTLFLAGCLLTFLPACLAVAAPWCIAIHRQAPDFWRYFVVEEHWIRFTGANIGQHSEPWWYFLALLIPLVMPSGLLYPCVFRGLRGQWGGLFKQSYMRYLACFFIFPFLFFSACSGKLATYILPCMIPIAALGGIGIAEYFRLGGKYRSFRGIMIFAGVIFVLAGIGGMVIGFLPFPEAVRNALPFPAELFRRLIPAGVTALIFGIVLLYQRNKSWNRNLTAFFAGQVPLIFCILWGLDPRFFGDKTPYSALKVLEQHIPADAEKVIVHRACMHGAAWTWKRTDLTLAWSQSEWDYPIAHGFAHRYMTAGEVEKFLRSPDRPKCVLLFPEKTFRRNAKYFPEGCTTFVNNELLLAIYPAAEGKR